MSTFDYDTDALVPPGVHVRDQRGVELKLAPPAPPPSAAPPAPPPAPSPGPPSSGAAQHPIQPTLIPDPTVATDAVVPAGQHPREIPGVAFIPIVPQVRGADPSPADPSKANHVPADAATAGARHDTQPGSTDKRRVLTTTSHNVLPLQPPAVSVTRHTPKIGASNGFVRIEVQGFATFEGVESAVHVNFADEGLDISVNTGSGTSFSYSDPRVLSDVSKFLIGRWARGAGDKVSRHLPVPPYRADLQSRSGPAASVTIGSVTYESSLSLPSTPTVFSPLERTDTLRVQIELPRGLGTLTYGVTVTTTPETRRPGARDFPTVTQLARSAEEAAKKLAAAGVAVGVGVAVVSAFQGAGIPLVPASERG